MHITRLARSARHRAARAPLAFALIVALAALVAPAGPAARPILAAVRPATETALVADLSPAEAESGLVAMINADRAAVGLRPLRLDARLSAIAHERSASMASTGQLSHVQADGRTMVDLVNANGIRWYRVGETIGWNNYASLRDSTRVVDQGWMSSPEHAAIILATDSNYVGVGLGRTATGGRYWTAVFLSGPDRTGPWAKMLAPTPGALATLSSGRQVRMVTWRWSGADRPLAAFTSGLRSFEVQRRIDGGAWVSVRTATTGRVWSSDVWVGHRFSVRVRARDNAGNVGNWSSPSSFSA